MSEHHNTIHYIELPAVKLGDMKTFYGDVFGWTFTNYGPGYAAFHGAGVEGGFDESREYISPQPAGVFVILYSDDLESTEAAIIKAGGVISTAAYDFPGGRRFHFQDPSGNELGVWVEVKA